MINNHKLKLTSLQQEIVRLFYKKVEIKLHPRTIALLLHVSHPAVSKALPLLVQKSFLIVQKEKNSPRFFVFLNRDNPLIIGLKRAENLRVLYESMFIAALYDHFPSATIILFGSYAFGEDTSTSDIDLAIIGTTQKNVDFAAFEKKLERPITINYYPSLQDIDKPLLNNILNGITLKGAVEL